MEPIEEMVEVLSKDINHFNDGFDCLVCLHRIAGIVYIGYDKNQTNFRKLLLVSYGVLMWSILTITNLPCIFECYLNREQFLNDYGLYTFYAMFMIFNTCNVIAAILYTIRGKQFRKLIDNLRQLVIDRKELSSLKTAIYVYIGVSILFMFCRFFLFIKMVTTFSILRILEDFLSEILTDSTGFLLIYFSLYFSLICRQLTRSIEKSKDFSQIDEWFYTLTNIQKQIKFANSLLTPCLLLLFSFSILFLISFWVLVQTLTDYNSNFSIENVWPLLVIYVIRMLFWCLFVDNMNQKNKEVFETISSLVVPNIEDRVKIQTIVGLQQNQQTFNASNFFNINKSLFLSVAGFAISYMLLFTQLVR